MFKLLGENKEGTDKLKILAWTNSIYGRDWQVNGSKGFEQCTFKNCVITTNHSDYNTSDAVIFNVLFHVGFPKYRFQHQKWIMHIHENPIKHNDNYGRFNNLFNATWSYRQESDVWTNYSHPGSIGGLIKMKKKYLFNL